MKLINFLMLGLISALISGCEPDTMKIDTIKHNDIKVENTSRLKIVEEHESDTWRWKILKDSKSEKEWIIIHDNTRMVVVPLDGGIITHVK